jgi:hypothetical protein
LRETVEGILERDVPDDHVLDGVDADVGADDPGIGPEANERRVAREVDANAVLLFPARRGHRRHLREHRGVAVQECGPTYYRRVSSGYQVVVY